MGSFSATVRSEMHITVTYHGHIRVSRVERAAQLLERSLNGCRPVRIEVVGGGVFRATGSDAMTDVVWAGVRADTAQLFEIRNACRTALGQLGHGADSQSDLTFRPHVTLWRGREMGEARCVRLVAALTERGSFGSFAASKVTMFSGADGRYIQGRAALL